MNVNEYIELKLVHSLHTSGIKSFLGCRRRYNWIFNEMYYPHVTAKPLEFGVAYHEAMETYYSPETWSWVRNPYKRPIVIARAIKAFRDKCLEQKNNYLKIYEDLDPVVRKDYEERLELGAGMLQYHLEAIYPYDQNFVPIAVEVAFEVPIVNPDTAEQLWCRCNQCWTRYLAWGSSRSEDEVRVLQGRYGNWFEQDRSIWGGLPVTYGGRVDMLAQDMDLHYWIYDWKTAARLHSDNDEFLDLDWQITSYVWALRLKLGLDIVGFVYHEQKKGYPQPPEPLASGRRYKGKLFQAGKTLDTNYPIYLATVRENDPEGFADGSYDEYLQYLQDNPPRYAERFEKYRNAEEMLQAGRDIYQIACDIVDPNLRIYPNSGRFGCQTCAFRQPCVGQNRGEDYKYTLETMFEKRTKHYWESKVPSTDSKGGE